MEITTTAADDVIPVGSNVTLTCVARTYEGKQPYWIMWFVNGGPFRRLECYGDYVKDKMDEMTCALTIVNGSTKDSGTYECNAYHGNGECITYATRNLTWKGKGASQTTPTRPQPASRDSGRQGDYRIFPSQSLPVGGSGLSELPAETLL